MRKTTRARALSQAQAATIDRAAVALALAMGALVVIAGLLG